ncbi:alpha/beta hydrolase [Rhodococcus rhodnii]|nr:alpha/beta hydrolase [Rhodococcus rhodnii]
MLPIAGVDTFVRTAGPPDAPVLLLPHGYPCSSYEFRDLMPALADRWRTVAPDLPGFGYSADPDFPSTFADYATWLGRFADEFGLDRYALWLHDYGSQIGLELAMSAPERVTALIVQNGDIYEDVHGPKYAPLKQFWENPTDAARAEIATNISQDGFRDEFVGEVDETVARRVPPDLWTLHWTLMDTPVRRARILELIENQASTLDRFALQQRYLREHTPPTLIVWGPQDGYMPEESARAYLRDLPDALLHLVPDGGHWLLETHLDDVVPRVREFLAESA